PELHEAITKLGLDYNLMTQFTSFVAVEETVVTEGGKPMRVDVPVEMPHGMSYEGVFGGLRILPAPMANHGVFGGGFLSRQKAAMAAPQAMPVSMDEMQQPSRKLDPSLLQKSGKVRVKIWMNDTSKESVDLLRVLGAENLTMPQVGTLVIAT